MYRIAKEFRFEAAHHLPLLHEGHRCRDVHGHSYRVRVMLQAEVLRHNGMVVDFGELTPLKEYLDQRFDHSLLNDIVEQPTCEHLARHLFDWCCSRWPQVVAVRVYETATCWGEYTR